MSAVDLWDDVNKYHAQIIKGDFRTHNLSVKGECAGKSLNSI